MKLGPCSQWLVVFGGEKLWRSHLEIDRGEGWAVFCGGVMFRVDGGCGGRWAC
jgi:hypothetical protein